MKEKFIMTTFFAGGMADIATTAIGLNAGFKEIGFLGSYMSEMNNMTGAYIVRTAISAILIGLYALTKEKNSRFAISFDGAVRISNVISWGVVALNAVQVAHALR